MRSALQVVIVGGGTSGWMTAVALAKLLPKETCQVQLIESEDIGIIGVGEATIPHAKSFMQAVGIDEVSMMRETQATFKLGIEFAGWGKDQSAYFHPFGDYGEPYSGLEFIDLYLKAKAGGANENIEDYCFAVAMSKRNVFAFPKADSNDIGSTFAYAYHFDAGLYARYLRRHAETHGVERIEGRIVSVTRNPESGFVESVRLEDGQSFAGDLFIDCSGFAAVLFDKTLQVGWEDWSHWLPCDRAIAAPSEKSASLEPYTRATTQTAGWTWRIPLQTRTGNGYVYSSAFATDTDALDTLTGAMGTKPLTDPRLLTFRPGRRVKSWAGNCVAIGLASGFLEPLESTSIYLAQAAILKLIELFPAKDCDVRLANAFNRQVDNEYDRIRDFLILHYHACQRLDGDLWGYTRNMVIPDSLSNRIELFRRRGFVVANESGLFRAPSWIAVYLGQGIFPERYSRLADRLSESRLSGFLSDYRQRMASSLPSFAPHRSFVEDYCHGAR